MAVPRPPPPSRRNPTILRRFSVTAPGRTSMDWCLSVCGSDCLSVWLSVCPSDHLSVSLWRLADGTSTRWEAPDEGRMVVKDSAGPVRLGNSAADGSYRTQMKGWWNTVESYITPYGLVLGIAMTSCMTGSLFAPIWPGWDLSQAAHYYLYL